MAQIVPTITAQNAHTYREQLERVQEFAKRMHIDLMDGKFAPTLSVVPGQVWWPEGIVADIHIMFQEPQAILAELVLLGPNLVILPAESKFEIDTVCETLGQNSIKLGLALMPETRVEEVKYINRIDHLLIFSGNLGYQGGSFANLDLLEKVSKAKVLNPQLEISWDGGISDSNVHALAAAGVDILNVGGYIQGAHNAQSAFNKLTTLLP